jgi:hypothetical protein
MWFQSLTESNRTKIDLLILYLLYTRPLRRKLFQKVSCTVDLELQAVAPWGWNLKALNFWILDWPFACRKVKVFDCTQWELALDDERS